MSEENKDKVFCVTDGQLRKVVRDTVHETLTAMGVDVSNPLEMQRDLQHLREVRVAKAVLKRHTLKVAIGVVVTATLAALWVGFKDFIHS